MTQLAPHPAPVALTERSRAAERTSGFLLALAIIFLPTADAGGRGGQACQPGRERAPRSFVNPPACT
jgi:hypothetical protein